jgi:hypothetical protein
MTRRGGKWYSTQGGPHDNDVSRLMVTRLADIYHWVVVVGSSVIHTITVQLPSSNEFRN